MWRHVEYNELALEERSSEALISPSNPEVETIRLEHYARLRRAMECLTERQYEYLLLRAEGLKLREIAEIEGVSVQSVAEVCARAMDRLARLSNE
jgi:RNA polymerase sigma factor (sigma-70 family)